jgi:Na+-transporting NADH:ubiquinone oxidoreductase subunit NqrC
MTLSASRANAMIIIATLKQVRSEEKYAYHDCVTTDKLTSKQSASFTSSNANEAKATLSIYDTSNHHRFITWYAILNIVTNEINECSLYV